MAEFVGDWLCQCNLLSAISADERYPPAAEKHGTAAFCCGSVARVFALAEPVAHVGHGSWLVLFSDY